MSDEKPKLHIEGDWKSEAQAEQAERERLSPVEGAPAESGIHVDSDWKAQAQAEKERLAREEQEKAHAREETRALPDASFHTLVSMLASQAIMGLGALRDPQSGAAVIDLEGAKLSIDLLGVLEEKTKGNLEEDEGTELTQLLGQLRQQFVAVSQHVAQAAASGKVVTQPAPGSPGTIPGPRATPGSGSATGAGSGPASGSGGPDKG